MTQFHLVMRCSFPCIHCISQSTLFFYLKVCYVFLLRNITSVPCKIDGSAALFQYGFPISFSQLLPITAVIKLEYFSALLMHSILCSQQQSLLSCIVTSRYIKLFVTVYIFYLTWLISVIVYQYASLSCVYIEPTLL